MLETIFAKFGGEIVDRILGRITGVFEAYFKKQVSIEELRTKLAEALIDGVKEIERAHADSITKTFESFQQTLRQVPELRTAWKAVVYSQLFVLVWHQMAIPFIVFMEWVKKYPSSGSTVEWAYALLAFMFGAGAVILRGNNPGGSSYIDKLKGLIGR